MSVQTESTRKSSKAAVRPLFYPWGDVIQLSEAQVN